MSFELKDENCEPCEFITMKSVKAELFCYDCRERYCEMCVLDHSKFRVLRNHQIYSLRSQSSGDDSDYLTPVNTRSMKACSQGDTQQWDEYLQKIGDRSDTTGIQSEGTGRDEYVNLVINTTSQHRAAGKGQDVDVVEQKETDTPESVPPCFDLKVLDTDLARRIKGVNKDDILRCVFKLTMEKSCLSLSFEKKTVFKCAYNSVRRYGIKGDTILIEIGRTCEIGPGFLKVTTGQAKEMFHLFRTF